MGGDGGREDAGIYDAEILDTLDLELGVHDLTHGGRAGRVEEGVADASIAGVDVGIGGVLGEGWEAGRRQLILDVLLHLRVLQDLHDAPHALTHDGAVDVGSLVVGVDQRHGGRVGASNLDATPRGWVHVEDARGNVRAIEGHVDVDQLGGSGGVDDEGLGVGHVGGEQVVVGGGSAVGLDGGGQLGLGRLLGDDPVGRQALEEGRVGPVGAPEGEAGRARLPPLAGGEVVVEVLADLGVVVDEGDVVLGQQRRGPDAGELEHLRGAVGAGGDDDLLGGRELGAVGDLDAHGRLLAVDRLEQHALDEGVGQDLDVLVAAQPVRLAGQLALAGLEVFDQLGAADRRAVVGVGDGVDADLGPCRGKRVAQRILAVGVAGRYRLGRDRPAEAVLQRPVGAVAGRRRVVVLGALEELQPPVVAPRRIAHQRRPVVEVGLVSPRPRPVVGRAAARERLACRCVHVASADIGLRHRRVRPVDVRVVLLEGIERCRRERVLRHVLARLNHEDVGVGQLLRETRREHRPGNTAASDDEVPDHSVRCAAAAVSHLCFFFCRGTTICFRCLTRAIEGETATISRLTLGIACQQRQTNCAPELQTCQGGVGLFGMDVQYTYAGLSLAEVARRKRTKEQSFE